jgi:addiction module RelE/StbE family toxin
VAQVKLKWSRVALRDIDSAREYIEEHNPRAASAVVTRIEAATAALSRHPQIGRPGRVADTRELVVTGTPLIVAYRIRGNMVEILAVIHSARQWPPRF